MTLMQRAHGEAQVDDNLLARQCSDVFGRVVIVLHLLFEGWSRVCLQPRQRGQRPGPFRTASYALNQDRLTGAGDVRAAKATPVAMALHSGQQVLAAEGVGAGAHHCCAACSTRLHGERDPSPGDSGIVNRSVASIELAGTHTCDSQLSNLDDEAGLDIVRCSLQDQAHCLRFTLADSVHQVPCSAHLRQAHRQDPACYTI